MTYSVFNAPDPRQAPQWGEYLKKIGWQVEWVGKSQVFIRQLPLINASVIKIQRPIGPIPFAKIDRIAHQYQALCTVLEPHLLGFHQTAFLKYDYQPSKLRFAHTATIKIDLTQTQAQLWRSFSDNARRNINKAQGNQLRIETIFLKKEFDDQRFRLFYQLLKAMAKQKKFFITSYDDFASKMTAFKDSSILLSAYHGRSQEPLAMLWLAYFNQVVFYVHPAITPVGYKLLANYLLVWEGLKLAKKLNLKVFDFESIYDPRFPKDHPQWQGYTEFKKRWHGTIIEYPPAWIKFYNLPFKLLYLCATIFSR